jgi:hypothetical protein
MTTSNEITTPHPVAAASRLLAGFAQHDLAELVGPKIAMDIEVAARFTIRQHQCSCAIEEQTHVAYDNCPHPLAGERYMR